MSGKEMEAVKLIPDPCLPETIERVQAAALRAYHREIDANCPADMAPSPPDMVDEIVERNGRPFRLIGARFRYERKEIIL